MTKRLTQMLRTGPESNAELAIIKQSSNNHVEIRLTALRLSNKMTFVNVTEFYHRM